MFEQQGYGAISPYSNFYGNGNSPFNNNRPPASPPSPLKENLDTALAIVEAVKDLANHNAELHMRIAHDEHDMAGNDGHPA